MKELLVNLPKSIEYALVFLIGCLGIGTGKFLWNGSQIEVREGEISISAKAFELQRISGELAKTLVKVEKQQESIDSFKQEFAEFSQTNRQARFLEPALNRLDSIPQHEIKQLEDSLESSTNTLQKVIDVE